jgi:hypothetical protein
LNPAEACAQDSRQGFDGQCLGRSRHAFDQGVTFSEQSHQDLFDRFILADNDFAQFVLNVCDSCGDVFRHSFVIIPSRDSGG